MAIHHQPPSRAPRKRRFGMLEGWSEVGRLQAAAHHAINLPNDALFEVLEAGRSTLRVPCLSLLATGRDGLGDR